MNQQRQSFFRGGGLICSNQIPQDTNPQDEQIIYYDLIRDFFLDLENRCASICDLSKSIQSQESQDEIIRVIKQIQLQSQFVNQASRNYAKVKEYIKQILGDLEQLLDCITNTIVSQRFITLQILKICNQLSRLIFQYYANDQSIPLDQDRQQSILAIINQIELLLNQGGEQLYYNSIYYELFITKLCIEICPTNSEEGKEVLLNIISGIQASLEELSTDLLVSLAQGGLYLYKEIKKRKQTNMFKIIFYLEEFKYKIIEKIQQGLGINKIIKQLVNNYNILIKNSNEWLIKCSWIKIISELIIYKPIITKKQYQVIKFKYQLQTEWEDIIQKRLIKIIDDKKIIGIIQQNDENSNTNRILQQQIIKFQMIQSYIINGEKNLPKLEQLKEFSTQQQEIKQEQNKILFQYLQDLPLDQFIFQLNEYCQQIVRYTELFQDFTEEILENKNINKQYLLQQIEQIIIEGDLMDNLWYQLILHNNILQGVLNKFVIQSDNTQITSVQLFLIINQIIEYFQIAKQLEYKFDDLQTEFINQINSLQTQYNFNGQVLEKLNLFQHLQQHNDVDKLLLKLQEIKLQDKKVKSPQEVFQYIVAILIILQNIQKNKECFIKHHFALLNIKSLIHNNSLKEENILTKIQYFCPQKDVFQQMFTLYSNISNLRYIYQQINENQQILVANISDDINLGLNINTLQFNYRVEELAYNLINFHQQIEIQYQNQENLEDKIQFLCVLEFICIRTEGQFNRIIYDLANQLDTVDKFITNQQQQNPANQIIEQLEENNNQLSQDIDIITFQDFLQKRIDLYRSLQQLILESDIPGYIQFLELIAEDAQQKYQNIQKPEVLLIIQQQQEKLIEQYRLQKSIDNSSQMLVARLYQKYIIALRDIIQNINFYKLKDDTNYVIHDVTNMINKIKLQKYLQRQLDQETSIKFNLIIEIFKRVYAVNLEQLQIQLNQQEQLLKECQEQLSIDDVKIIFPSYQSLIDRVVDKNNKLSLKQKALQFINDSFTGDVWRIKDYLYYNCLAFQQYLNDSNQKVVGQLLLLARFKETDYRIINTLKGKDQIQQMDALINNQWEETQEQVNNELQLTLNELQALQLSLQSEERKEIRDQLLQKHKNLEQQLEQQMKNVSEIGDVLGVTVYFLKDIKRDLAVIQNKLDNIINSIDQIGQDIKFLRGKTPQQILEIRMQSVLQNKTYQDAQSVYVQMKTLEFDFNLNQEKQEQTPLFNFDNQKNGEIDEFLTENKKSSLLIHGAAGSGKSLTARKIEEYLWLLYQKQCQNKLWSDIKGTAPLIPIFIQLPTLKEPKFNAFEETLLSSLYRFDQKQIDLLKDTAQKNQIRLIFIMDSYDELPQQYQGINLLQTNKVHLWKPQNQLQIPRVITTSRTEAFSTNDYRAWFWENETQGFQSLKELRLLPFDDQQRQDYLKQFSRLKLKISIYELFQVIDKKQDKDQILQDTQDIWNNIQQQVSAKIQQENRYYLLEQVDIQKLMMEIKTHKNVILFNQEQETAFTKLISKLWHQNLYKESIEQMNLNQLLETPFMLNIIVEVIPLMNDIVSQPNNIKKYFLKNFMTSINEFLENLFDNNIQITEDETKKLKELYSNKTKLISETLEVWEQLLNNNFFSNWSIQSTYEYTLDLLQRNQINFIKTFPNIEENFQIILYKSLKSHKLTMFDFFDKFIEQYIENQRQKLIYSSDIMDQNQFEQDIHKYAIKLSVTMFSRQETVIERKAQGILFRDNLQDPYLQFFDDSDKFGIYRKQIRKCIPLRQKGNYYQFMHKSIQEFLFAKQQMNLFIQAYEQMDSIQKLVSHYRKNDKQLDFENIEFPENQANLSKEDHRRQEMLINILIKFKDSILNQINLQDTFNLGALKFIKVKMIQELDLYQILEPLVLLSSIYQRYVRFSSNCLIILLSVQDYQFQKDFSKIIISDISLDGAVFEQCNLSHSKFEKVSIKGINLNFSNISNCEWNGIYSYELPSIKIEGSQCISWISPVGNQILSFSQGGSTENQILIWDYKQGLQLQSLQNKSAVFYAIYSNNGQIILSYGSDQVVRLWNSNSFNLIKEHKLSDKDIDQFWVKFIYSQDDKQIAYCFDKNIGIINNIQRMNQVILIELQNKCITQQFYTNGLKTLLQTPDSKYLKLQTWNTQTGAEIQNLSQEISKQVQSYQAVFKDNLIFIVFSNFTIEKWDTIELKQQGSAFKGHISSINYIDVSKNGKLLVSCGDDQLIIIYDIKSCNAIQTLIGHKQNINIVQFSPESNFLVSCADDQEIRFWDLKINKEVENQSIQDIAFTHDGRQIACASKNEIIFFSTQSGSQCDKIYEKSLMKCLAFHPKNGNFLLYTTGYQTKTVDIRLLRQVGQTKQTERQVFKLGYSSDGQKIFLAFEKIPQKSVELVQIFNLNWELLHEYNGGNFKTLQFSSNNEYLMDFDSNGTYQSVVVLFELSTFSRKTVQNNSRFDTFCLSNDSKQFLGISDQNILTLWSLSDQSQLIKKTQILYNYQIVKLEQSSDNKYVLCGSLIGDIVKFNLITDQIDNIFQGYQNEILKIIFSRDEHYFTALSNQQILILWQKDKQDSSFYITKYINPNKISQRTLLNNLKFDDVKLKSYLDYDIAKLFEKRQIEDQKQYVSQLKPSNIKIQKKYVPQSGAIVVRNQYITGHAGGT